MVLELSIRTSASPRRKQSDLASGTLTMWFYNRVYVARLHLAQQQSDWASGTLNMMKLGSGTGWAAAAVRTDRRECQNSYVDFLTIEIGLYLH